MPRYIATIQVGEVSCCTTVYYPITSSTPDTARAWANGFICGYAKKKQQALTSGVYRGHYEPTHNATILKVDEVDEELFNLFSAEWQSLKLLMA